MLHKWLKGPAEWIDGDTAFISVVFTWDMPQVWQRARWLHASGLRVKIGGPGTFVKTKFTKDLASIAEIGGNFPDAVAKHNPDATFASRGCNVGCWFCIVPKMEGRDFTLIDDFIVRPILCDNNLSALPFQFQEHIVQRYANSEIPLLDANSGFEPRAFNEDVYALWSRVNKGPWRFALDDQGDLPYVLKTLDILKDVAPNRTRVYVLIGNEPFESCMERVQVVLDRGGEPHVQPLMKLNAEYKRPWVRFDWTEQKLKDVARWVNRRIWRYAEFSEYDRYRKSSQTVRGRAQK